MPSAESCDRTKVVENLRLRAEQTRKLALVFVATIVIVVLAMIAFFYFAAAFEDFGPIRALTTSTTVNSPEERLKDLPGEVRNEVIRLEEEIYRLQSDIKFTNAYDNYGVAIRVTQVVIRVSTVFLAVYLIQILVGLTRYHFKVADHLAAASVAIELSNDDDSSLDALFGVLSTKGIHFGKTPSAPHESASDLVKELVRKIPST